ncbi:Pycsar system effector family protein [Bacillus sanguinis]
MEQNNTQLESATLFDYHKHNLVYIGDNIKFADGKSGILLTVNIALISFIFQMIKNISFPIQNWHGIVLNLSILIALLFLLYSAFQFVSVLLPRFPKTREYYMSWGGMASFTLTEYISKISSITHEELLHDMAKTKSRFSKNMCYKI